MTITVYLLPPAPPKRPNYVARYKDPTSGKIGGERSTGTRVEREAQRFAARWEDELNAGRGKRAVGVPWQTFVDEYLAALAANGRKRTTRARYSSACNVLARECSPRTAAAVTTATLDDFRRKLRAKGVETTTINTHLRHLKAALRWGKRKGYVTGVPDFEPIPEAPNRGRALTDAEFARMLAETPGVVGEAHAKAWQFFLRGLWLSGLRRTEGVHLRWDDTGDAIYVDLAGARPVFRIPAGVDKSGKGRAVPMAPDFAELLATVPTSARVGEVFKLHKHDPVEVGKVVSAIGKAAGVVTLRRGSRVEYASCHDLRRSFGDRWARRLPNPRDLLALMRHETLATTLRFYAEADVEGVGDRLADALGGDLGGGAPGDEIPESDLPLFLQ